MAKKRKVYSGEGWSFEPAGGKKESPAVSPPPSEQKIRIGLEKRNRGKEVTVVSGIALSPADRGELLKELKKLCGAGGTGNESGIAIQGDHRETVRKTLSAKGWNVK